jgi:lipoprotein-anchoring transpeptidase ErfK/SrfK
MERGRLVAVVLAALAFGAAVVVLLSGGSGDPAGPPAPREAVRTPAQRSAPAAPLGARLLRRTQLRARPGGRVVASIGTVTEYRSKRVLAVVERRGAWLGVLSEDMPRNRVGWIPTAAAELRPEPYGIEVDLSRRRMTVLHGDRAVRRMRVAVGLPGTATPTGRYGVTDALRIGGGSAAYGCCALALTARQPNVPQGWTGGDRVAIHGTNNLAALGTAASAGCLRTRNVDMRYLMKRIRLGAPVHIRA